MMKFKKPYIDTEQEEVQLGLGILKPRKISLRMQCIQIILIWINCNPMK